MTGVVKGSLGLVKNLISGGMGGGGAGAGPSASASTGTSATDKAEEQRRRVLKDRVKTILTSGQGLAEGKKTIMGG